MRVMIVTQSQDELLNDWLMRIRSGKRSMLIKAILLYAIKHNIPDRISLDLFTPEACSDAAREDQNVDHSNKTADSDKSISKKATSFQENVDSGPKKILVPQGKQQVQNTPAPKQTPRWKIDHGEWGGPYLEIGESLSIEVWSNLSVKEREIFMLAHIPIEFGDERAKVVLVVPSPKARDIVELEELYEFASFIYGESLGLG